MHLIWSIASREISRVRRRFSGGASPVTVVILLIGLALSVLAFRQTSLLGGGLFRVGVTGNVPPITDSRFAVTTLTPEEGQYQLANGAIDVYINDAQVYHREDDKSLYAVGALRRYLETQELVRVGEQYPQAQAFPLRVGVSYFDPTQPQSLPDLTKPIEGGKEEVIVPSLMKPKAPFVEVVVSLLFIMPVTFISIFFTSSFMDEKLNRRLTILLSTPVTPFQIIAGKMLPYVTFSMLAIAVIALITKANVLTALAIFIPTTLFIFAIYLMVPMFYRTFKDTTFISMLVTTLTTAFLVFPAMFNGVSDMALISPLTLAIKMYRGEPYGWREYLFPSLPMAAIFGIAVFASTRMLNEEFLMGYRPLTTKFKEAIFLVLDKVHPYRSIGLLSLLIIPVVYLIQLVALAISTNLPANVMLVTTLLMAALIEEVVKSIGIVVFIERGIVRSVKQVLGLAAMSALGFLVGEKLLLFFSISMVNQSNVSGALFGSGMLLLVPLLAHFVFTASITLLYRKFPRSYLLALVVGTVIHSIYNWGLMGGLR